MERELNADLDEWMAVDMCLHALDNAEVDVMHQTTMDLNENVLTSRVSGARSLREVRDSVTDTRRERLFETDGNERHDERHDEQLRQATKITPERRAAINELRRKACI
jgi:hypothetical protein